MKGLIDAELRIAVEIAMEFAKGRGRSFDHARHSAHASAARSPHATTNLPETFLAGVFIAAGSCPEEWCKSDAGHRDLRRGWPEFHAAGTADSMMMGSLLNGAMVSRLM
jgi:hypothetical protein